MSYMVHLSFQDSLESPRFGVLNLNIYATNGTYIAFCLDTDFVDIYLLPNLNRRYKCNTHRFRVGQVK